MKRVRSKTQRGRRRFVVEAAIAGALLVHVALLYLFRAEPVRPTSQARQAEPLSGLVSPSGESSPWELELRAWCELADPTLMSLPNSRHGFSQILSEKRILPYTEVPPAPARSVLAEEEAFPLLVLAKPLETLPEGVAETWQTPPPPVPPELPRGELPRGIFWRLPNGELLADAPKLPDEVVREAMAAGPPPAGPTRLEVTRERGQLRVRVRARSGNRALDMAVVRALTRALTQIERRGDQPRTAAQTAIMPGAGELRIVEVEWRLTTEGAG